MHTMTEREMERILQEEADEAKVMQAVREYRAERIEDKPHICDLLCATLKATRDQHDLKCIVYHGDTETETVTLAYEGGGSTSVNVALDSGIAMIRDILRAIH
jgi:hypothetical protein